MTDADNPHTPGSSGVPEDPHSQPTRSSRRRRQRHRAEHGGTDLAGERAELLVEQRRRSPSTVVIDKTTWEGPARPITWLREPRLVGRFRVVGYDAAMTPASYLRKYLTDTAAETPQKPFPGGGTADRGHSPALASQEAA